MRAVPAREMMWFSILSCNSRKNMQRNKQVAMGRKKFNMDPKKVGKDPL